MSSSRSTGRTRSDPGAAAASDPDIGRSVDAFRRILRALRLAARKTQMVAGVSAAQLFVLRSLQDGTEASISEIASRTMTDRSSVASVIERLVSAGLVSRATAREDRRRAAVTITRAGQTLLTRAPQAPTVLLVAGLERLNAEQLAMLSAGLTALTDEMGLSGQTAGMLFEDGHDAPSAPPRNRRG